MHVPYTYPTVVSAGADMPRVGQRKDFRRPAQEGVQVLQEWEEVLARARVAGYKKDLQLTCACLQGKRRRRGEQKLGFRLPRRSMEGVWKLLGLRSGTSTEARAESCTSVCFSPNKMAINDALPISHAHPGNAREHIRVSKP